MTNSDSQKIVDYNRDAWEELVRAGNRWTVPVSPEVIEAARNGDWSILLTPQRPVPRKWFGDLKSCDVLCLASGGGQQAPVLAAAGANVTVFDNSPGQLAQDRLVADREGLNLRTIVGDMSVEWPIENQSFDLIFNPCSVGFVPDVRPVWREARRVLRDGGKLMTGFCNPLVFLFDYPALQKGKLDARHSVPWSDLTSTTESERQALIDAGEPFCFGHTLNDLIGGQLDAGFSLIDMYEDRWGSGPESLLDPHIASFMATLGCLRHP